MLHRYPPTLGTALHSHHMSHTQRRIDNHMEAVQWEGRAEDQEARVLRAGPLPLLGLEVSPVEELAQTFKDRSLPALTLVHQL